MTCIAWDGKTLAADKRASDNGIARVVTKIRRASNGALCGCSGNVSRDAELFAWYDRGANPSDFPPTERDEQKCSMLVAIEPGPFVKFYSTTPYPAIFEGPRFAMGSGRDFAEAAMFLGLSARDAVNVACTLNTGCGDGIDALELNP